MIIVLYSYTNFSHGEEQARSHLSNTIFTDAERKKHRSVIDRTPPWNVLVTCHFNIERLTMIQIKRFLNSVISAISRDYLNNAHKRMGFRNCVTTDA